MNALETLLGRRWILKSENKDLYFQVKDEIGKYKKFLTEKLGYQLIMNPSLVKIEKIPSRPERWMGIMDFKEPIEYSFFCLILMFLEDKEAEEQFVLSEVTEYVQGNYEREQIDWTLYKYRRHLIRVLRYCAKTGLIQLDDGNEDGFGRNYSVEVLYENTGVSRYFMRNFTQDIMEFQCIEDFQDAEWIGVEQDRGIVRRQRVYRSILMTAGITNTPGNEEDFAYIKNYRNMVAQDLEDEGISGELQVYRSGAYLVLEEGSRMGITFPEDNTLSDIFLLLGSMVREAVESRQIRPDQSERIRVSGEQLRQLLEECKNRYGAGFSKIYRQMTSEEFYKEVSGKLVEFEFIKEYGIDWYIMPLLCKVIGRFSSDVGEGVKQHEQ